MRAKALIEIAAGAVMFAATAIHLAGCGERFTDVEMHLGSEEKIRPFAIVCDPPEAAPGDTIAVTLLCWSPDPASVGVSWRVALDFSFGRYGADEVERRIVDLEAEQFIPRPVDTGYGFLSQTFTYVVPESVLCWSSALPTPLRDEAIVALAAALLEEGADPTSKTAVEGHLRGLSRSDMEAMDPVTQAMAFALADRFACRIRFRATLVAGMTGDVTRTVTIRYSGRLGSPNTSANPEVEAMEVLAIPYPGVDAPDDPRYQDEILRYPFVVGSGGGRSGEDGVPQARVPYHSGWTYYLAMSAGLQEYTSPSSGDRLFREKDTYRWYYIWLDDPANPYEFLRDNAGEPSEMWRLDKSVRLVPPPVDGEARYRVIGCLRAERPEWEMYETSPGLTVAVGDIVFTPGSGRGRR